MTDRYRQPLKLAVPSPPPAPPHFQVALQAAIDDCSLWNYGGGESILADLNGGTVVLQNCRDAIVKGDARYVFK